MGKKCNQEARQFAEQFDENIHTLRNDLMDSSIIMGQYRYFTIRDPKVRTICAAPFRERVVQHAIMNICHQYFDRMLIDTVYASRQGKGVYAALEKAEYAMSHFKYSVKMDVRKFYDSIAHQVVKDKLSRMFKDAWLLSLFSKIIDGYSVELGCGLPIGNLTSQYFANNYLSELDHKAKECWKAPIYIRYMDDILIAGDEKEVLKNCVLEMTDYALNHLKLTFKPPIFHNTDDGQVFLGYRVLPYCCKLSGRSKRRYRAKLLQYDKLLNEGVWGESQYKEHILPLVAFVKHASSKAFCRSCIEKD